MTIDSCDASSSRIAWPELRPGRAGRTSPSLRNGRSFCQTGSGSTVSRYSSAVPRRYRSSVCKAVEGEPNGIRRQHQGEQREQVLQAAAGSSSQHLCFHRRGVVIRQIDELAGLPDAALHRHLPHHHIEHPISIDLEPGDLPCQIAQRPGRPEANLEPPVAHRLEQPLEGLAGLREAASTVTSRRRMAKSSGWIQQVTHEDGGLGPCHRPERPDGLRRYLVPGQQLDRRLDQVRE